MRRSTYTRFVPMLVIFAMLALACSRVPPGGEVALGGGATDQAVSPDGVTGFEEAVPETDFGTGGAPEFDDAGAATGGGTTADAASGGAAGSGAAGGGAAGSGAAGGGAAGEGGQDSGGQNGAGQAAPSGGGQGQAAPAGSGPGVEGKTITVAFHEQFSDCPTAPNNPEDSYYAKARKVMTEYTKFFNQFVLKERGLTLKPVLVDDGGYYCPERQRAAALKIAKEIKPFATFGNSLSAQGPIVADVVTRAGSLHIGINWQFQAEERARHPYAWNIFPTAEKSLQFMVGWMQRRIKGTKVPNRSTPANTPVGRVYGILGLDEQVGRQLVKVTRDGMARAGIPIKGTYFISPDTGVSAQQAPSVVAKMRQDGVNTLVWALQFGDGKGFFIPLTETMDKQNYLPDIILGTGGAPFFEQLAARRVWANVKGTSPVGIVGLRVAVTPDGKIVEEYDKINDNVNAYLEAWQEKLGHNDQPTQDYGNAYNVWADLSLLAAGLLNAGNTLNAQTLAQGLETAAKPGSPNRCSVGRFMGRDYKHVGSYEWDAAHDGGGEGFTTVYWVNQKTPLGTLGYYESYDNYVYFLSPAQIPPKPTHDTGKKGTAVAKQKSIGIKPWKSCSQFPNYPK